MLPKEIITLPREIHIALRGGVHGPREFMPFSELNMPLGDLTCSSEV